MAKGIQQITLLISELPVSEKRYILFRIKQYYKYFEFYLDKIQNIILIQSIFRGINIRSSYKILMKNEYNILKHPKYIRCNGYLCTRWLAKPNVSYLFPINTVDKLINVCSNCYKYYSVCKYCNNYFENKDLKKIDTCITCDNGINISIEIFPQAEYKFNTETCDLIDILYSQDHCCDDDDDDNYNIKYGIDIISITENKLNLWLNLNSYYNRSLMIIYRIIKALCIYQINSIYLIKLFYDNDKSLYPENNPRDIFKTHPPLIKKVHSNIKLTFILEIK